MEEMVTKSFWKDKKVLVTGHTGFKGSWLCLMLQQLGAKVVGYSLEPPTTPSLFEIANIEDGMKSVIGDISDFEKLKELFKNEQPEIVFHLAAQPIVSEGYKNPLYTYQTNVMGTANVLQCIMETSSVRSVLNITTDKVYENKEDYAKSYKEEDPLDGYDPYSNSKSCSELVTHSYCRSFFNDKGIAVSTARAGNVIGGGDFAVNRIIPDCVRAILSNGKIVLRNPNSIRPYQHVLEPITAYLMIVERQYFDNKLAGSYNVGPEEDSVCTTKDLVDTFIKLWEKPINVVITDRKGPHEANFLRLNCSKLKKTFNWKPIWNIDTAVRKTVEWTYAYINKLDVKKCMIQQIKDYFANNK